MEKHTIGQLALRAGCSLPQHDGTVVRASAGAEYLREVEEEAEYLSSKGIEGDNPFLAEYAEWLVPSGSNIPDAWAIFQDLALWNLVRDVAGSPTHIVDQACYRVAITLLGNLL